MSKNNLEGLKQKDLFLSDQEVARRATAETVRREAAEEKRLSEEAAKEKGFVSAEERELRELKARIPWLEQGVKMGLKGLQERLDEARKALGDSGQTDIFDKKEK